jgi:hypothetical protein
VSLDSPRSSATRYKSNNENRHILDDGTLQDQECRLEKGQRAAFFCAGKTSPDLENGNVTANSTSAILSAPVKSPNAILEKYWPVMRGLEPNYRIGLWNPRENVRLADPLRGVYGVAIPNSSPYYRAGVLLRQCRKEPSNHDHIQAGCKDTALLRATGR